MSDELKVAPKNYVQEGKPQPTLIPMDVLQKYLVPAYQEGVVKYKRESWRGGFYISVLMDAAFRHLIEFYYHGHDYDEMSVTQKHHLSGALFSIISALHTLDTRPELDDRFSIQQRTESKRDTANEDTEQNRGHALSSVKKGFAAIRDWFSRG